MDRTIKWYPVAFALTLAFAACPQEAQVEQEAMPADTVDHEAALDQLRTNYEQAYNAGDAETLIGLYTEDYLEYTLQATMDYAGIVAALRDTTGFPPGANLAIQPDEFMVAESGDVAYGTGTTTFTGPGPDGAPMTANDRWLAVFRNVGGAWKLHRLAILPQVAASGTTTPAETPAPSDTVATM